MQIRADNDMRGGVDTGAGEDNSFIVTNDNSSPSQHVANRNVGLEPVQSVKLIRDIIQKKSVSSNERWGSGCNLRRILAWDRYIARNVSDT